MSRIVVELADRWVETASGQETLEAIVGDARIQGQLQRLADVLAKFSRTADLSSTIDGFGTALLIQALPPRRKRALARSRSADRFPGFFSIELGDMPAQQREEFLEALQSLDGIIESASFEPTYRGAAPPVAAKPRSFKKEQFYLKAIGAGASPVPADKWHGIGFGVLDAGWFLQHEALKDVHAQFFPDNLAPPEHIHGTQVLGVLVGGAQMQGIAKGAMPKALIFTHRGESVAKPLLDFLYSQKYDSLEYGDILLIELEQNDSAGSIEGLPLEVQRASFTAIEFAVSEGIVVIEVAGNGRSGNGGWDLDHLESIQRAAPAWSERRRTTPGLIPDSGAILVTGCQMPQHPSVAPTMYDARDDLNFGSRVDSYGWSAGVLTCAKPQGYEFFTGSSSAAAMVAGIALATQRMAVDIYGSVLSPGQLRSLLKDPACGVPVVRAGKTIGFVPHLRKIGARLRQLARIVIGVYDGGATGTRAFMDPKDPDIVLSVGPTALPDKAPASITSGQTRYIHVRARNVGRGPARNVRATAYWSVHKRDPDDDVEWHPLGESKEFTLRRGAKTPVWLGPIALTLPHDLDGESSIDVVVSVGGRYDPRPLIPPVRRFHCECWSRSDMLKFVDSNVNTVLITIEVA